MRPREQIMLASLAQERAFGKAENMLIDHVHSGSVEFRPNASNVSRPSLREIADRLPERRAQQKLIEAKAAEPE